MNNNPNNKSKNGGYASKSARAEGNGGGWKEYKYVDSTT
jgi:hypothetical protein